MYLRTICLRINLRLNNIFYLTLFFEHFDYQINQLQISKWLFVIRSIYIVEIYSRSLILISKNSLGGKL